MATNRAVLVTLLVLLGLVGLPVWAYLTSDVRLKAAQNSSLASVPRLGQTLPNP
jgi:hypothetical protein